MTRAAQNSCGMKIVSRKISTGLSDGGQLPILPVNMAQMGMAARQPASTRFGHRMMSGHLFIAASLCSSPPMLRRGWQRHKRGGCGGETLWRWLECTRRLPPEAHRLSKERGAPPRAVPCMDSMDSMDVSLSIPSISSMLQPRIFTQRLRVGAAQVPVCGRELRSRAHQRVAWFRGSRSSRPQRLVVL